MRINYVKILLRKTDPGKCVLRVFQIDRSAERCLRSARRSQVHCHGHEIPQYTTMYHRTSNGWTMFRSINNLEMITIKKQQITGVEPRSSFRGHRPPPNVCRFVGSGKRRQSVSIRLSASRLCHSSFLWKVLSMSMVIKSLVTFTVWDNIVSLITNRWSDRPRLVNWWTVALKRRYELRHAN